MMPETLAYLNGQFVPASQLAIPVADAGFVFGAAATEFVRTFRGRLFRLDDHLTRLQQSCELCRIPLRVSEDELRAAAERLVKHNHSEGELAHILFATPGPLAHLGGADSGPTLGMHTTPLSFARYRRLFTDGARLVVPAIRGSTPIDPRAKMRSRMHWWIAEQQARDVDPHAWALLLDGDGFVTETAAANLLIVRDGTVLSPPRTTILNGVSLRVVEELCAELGIPFAERPLTLRECQSPDEAMLTGTAFCVAGVRAIDELPVRWPGPFTRRLLAAWSERVGVDIERQVLASVEA
jgi:branched-subunit amino acid aminotransferase/4-amino-4-deoxychorismate lyase